MVFLGIDVGFEGGIAVLDERARVLALHVMPLRRNSRGKDDIDVRALRALLQPFMHGTGFTHAAVEWAQSFGNERPKSMFSYGKGVGKVEATLDLLGIGYEQPLPQAWKAVVLHGTTKDKEAAIGYCSQRWPLTSLIPPACHVPADGLADALCICDYARRQFSPGV